MYVRQLSEWATRMLHVTSPGVFPGIQGNSQASFWLVAYVCTLLWVGYVMAIDVIAPTVAISKVDVVWDRVYYGKKLIYILQILRISFERAPFQAINPLWPLKGTAENTKLSETSCDQSCLQ
jgi:hypothetical protein